MNHPADNPAQDFLDEEVSVSYRHLLPSALRRAYATAARLIEAEPALQTPSGRFQKGDLIAHAAEYEVYRLIKTQVLPFEATWEPFARPTGFHLVVWTAHGRLTISQVEDWRKKPRSAEFRDNYAMSNMRDLFSDWNKEREEKSQRKHLLLLHGYQDLNFTYLTVPHSSNNYHLAHSPNLMSLLHVATPERAREEGPTESPEPEALEHLTRIVRDNSDD